MRFDPRPEIDRGRPGQCDLCGAFRPDGRAVTVHFTGCAAGPDASMTPVLRRGTAYMHADRVDFAEHIRQTRPVKRVKGKRVTQGPTIPENVPVQRGAWRRR